MVPETKLIEIKKSDSTKSIFSKLEKLATDSVAFRKKIDCYIPPQRVSTEGYTEVKAVSDDEEDR